MLKILVVGYGSIGKRHVKNLTNYKNIELIILTKIKSNNFLKKEKYKIVNSIEDAIKEKPDAALITNITSEHIDVGLKLAKNGIHLFIEKPLSNSLKKIKQLEKIIKKEKIISQIGCNLRFHPCVKKIRELIIKEVIGKHYSIIVENGSYLPDWHPYEDYKKSYASNEKQGGGVILTNIHEIDYLYWFFGKVNEVTAISGRISKLGIKAEDYSSIILKFNKNIMGEIHFDYFQRPSFRGCKIIGEKGTIIWNYNKNKVMIYNIKKKEWQTHLKLKKYDNNIMYIDEIEHFLKCVKEKKNSVNDIQEGIKVLKIALDIKKSALVKRTIKIK
jgi:predicted dehydrogenase